MPKKTASLIEEELAFQIRAMALPTPEREYRFAKEHVGSEPGMRKRLKARGLKDWRFDFAWPSLMIAVEVEGITVEGGRHQRIGGFNGDLEKYHCAMELGWNIYRTGRHLIKDGRAIRLISQVINSKNRRNIPA